MALDKTQLKSAILLAFKEAKAKTEDPEQAFDALAEKLSAAIDSFVKTGTVTVESGIAVSTTGSATAQTGSTTATGTGTIS